MIKKVTYAARKGSQFTDAKAQIYGEHLAVLSKGKEKLTTSEIVEDAKNKSTVTHDYFEWNNEIAGERHRIWQARQLVKSIHIVVIREDNPEPIVVPMFHNIRINSEERGYIQTETILNVKEFREQMLAEALREIDRWKDAYREYKELVLIFEAIEETRKIFSVHQS